MKGRGGGRQKGCKGEGKEAREGEGADRDAGGFLGDLLLVLDRHLQLREGYAALNGPPKILQTHPSPLYRAPSLPQRNLRQPPPHTRSHRGREHIQPKPSVHPPQTPTHTHAPPPPPKQKTREPHTATNSDVRDAQHRIPACAHTHPPITLYPCMRATTRTDNAARSPHHPFYPIVRGSVVRKARRERPIAPALLLVRISPERSTITQSIKGSNPTRAFCF